MTIYSNYRMHKYLNLEECFETNINLSNNVYRVKSLFKHSKKLIRSLLLLHFYIYSLYPFSPILFKTSARYHLKLDSTILVLAANDCYDSYFKFN